MKSGAAPAWARSLALAVCAEAGVEPPEVLRWRRAGRVPSSGLASLRARSIAVTAGSDADDARHTLLHELAHWLTPDKPRRGPRRRSVHHGAAFYRTALALFARHSDTLEAALRREATRYPSVLRHAAAVGLPEAELIQRERRAARAARSAASTPWRIVVPEHAVRLTRKGRWYHCATCGRRLVGRMLLRAARRGARERHTLWTREPADRAPAVAAG